MAVGYGGSGALDVSKWANINAVAAGTHYTVGLKRGGTVVVVGDNTYGQLDVSGWNNIKQPVCLDYVQPPTSLTSLPDFIRTLPGVSYELINSLNSKAENAIKVFDNGGKMVTVNILNALLNEISAQTGKEITIKAVATLTAYVQNLINHIQ